LMAQAGCPLLCMGLFSIFLIGARRRGSAEHSWLSGV